jgi:hypothetical protein
MISSLRNNEAKSNPVDRNDIIAALAEIDGQDSNAALGGFTSD